MTDKTSRSTQETAMQDKGFVTVTRAAEVMHQAPMSIYRAVEAGHLTTCKVGNRIYIEIASLKRWGGPLAEDL